MTNPRNSPRYSFEETWRFLNSYGSAYITPDLGEQVEARTGFTKDKSRVKKIIRFLVEDNEVRVSSDCWDHGVNCDEDCILGLRDKIADYIESTQIG